MVNNLFGPCLQGIGMLGNTFQHDAIVIWFYSRGLLSAYVSPGQAELPEMRQSCSCCIKDIVICSALISRFSSIPLSLRRSFTSIFSLAVNPTDWKRQICCLSWHRQTVIAWEVYVCVCMLKGAWRTTLHSNYVLGFALFYDGPGNTGTKGFACAFPHGCFCISHVFADTFLSLSLG